MKRLIALMLLACSLLSLCACGSKEETPSTGGTVIHPDVTDPGQTPASPDSGPEAALYQKYKSIIDYLEDKKYNSAINQILALAYAEQPKEPVTPMDSYFTGTWHLDTSDAVKETQPLTLKINDDKTVTINGVTYSILEASRGDTQLVYWLLKDGVHTYRLSLNKGKETVVPYIYLSNAAVEDGRPTSKGEVGTYTADPMTGILMNSWYTLDEYSKLLPNSFYVDREGARINNKDVTWTITASSANTITAQLGDAYMVTVELRGDKPIAHLTEKATGNTVSYYVSNNRYGYDRSWPEYIYPRALAYLEDAAADMQKGYTPSFHSYLEAESKNYFGNAALKFLYETFTALGSYKDSAKIAADFTILEDMHTHVTLDRVNNMGNTSTNNEYNLYTYNALGQVIRSYEPYQFLVYGGNDYYKYLFYYETGKLIRVQDGNGNNISTLVTLTYDDQGRMVGGDYKTNSYSGTHSYTYDAAGHMLTSSVWVNNYRYDTTYTYNANGQLTQSVSWYGTEYYNFADYRLTISYTYDDQGRMTSRTVLDEDYYYDSWDKTERYTQRSTSTIQVTAWDDQGRPLTANLLGNSNYTSQVLTYHYDDLYFYQDYTFQFNP